MEETKKMLYRRKAEAKYKENSTSGPVKWAFHGENKLNAIKELMMTYGTKEFDKEHQKRDKK